MTLMSAMKISSNSVRRYCLTPAASTSPLLDVMMARQFHSHSKTILRHDNSRTYQNHHPSAFWSRGMSTASTEKRGFQTTTGTKSTIAGAEHMGQEVGAQDHSPYLVQRLLGQKPNLYGTAKFSVVGDYIRPIAENLDRPVRILDLGCSTSISKEYLSTTLGDSVDFEYCGVDYEAAFEPDIVMDITEIHQRREELPWTPDVILMLDVLEHLPGKEKDIQKVVSESVNLLPPHGLVLAVVPQLYRLDRLKLNHLHYPEHQVRFTLEEWATIIQEGAEISEMRGIGYISCIPYLPMLSPWYRDDNGHGQLFRYLRGTAFEWEPLKPAEVFLTSLLGSSVQGWCNSSLLVLQSQQNENK
jgi:SAM-dependent methyltransferase